ncbi:MAG: hypothetical protein MUD17_05120 [Gemmatimonadaceae bacterium]|nr:hypothetical protein [Gemmatimonadaceae bacterium]
MDFYLPIRRHRETWSGGDDVLVALTFDQDSDYVTAFNTMGDAILVEGKSAEAGTNLIVLHPAEPKFPVVVSERESSGDHQQLSIAAGTSFAIPLGSTYVEGPEVRSSSTSSGVYLRYFDTWRDDGWFGGDLEMEFRSSGYEGGIPFNSGSGFFIFPSVTCVRGTGVGNFPSQPPVQANLLISPGLTSTSLLGCGGSSQTKGYAIWAYEMDFGPGAEDDFGMRFTSPGSMPYGLVVGTSSIAYNFFYSFPGTTAGQKSLYLGLRLQ